MTAGEIAARVTIAKPTLSAHFAILREADLVESDKAGTTITYRLKLSVLEEALFTFSHAVGIGVARVEKSTSLGKPRSLGKSENLGRPKSTRRAANAGP